MQVPEDLFNLASSVLGMEYEAAVEAVQANQIKQCWAVAYGLAPFKDGDQWCVLLGGDLQSGVSGFGDTPEKAIFDFNAAMKRT